MLRDHGEWKELHRCEGLARARTIATSIEAMEYDVRVVDVATGRAIDVRDVDAVGAADPDRRYALQTRPEECSELAGVLDQIIAEQDEFDDYLERRDNVVLRKQRVFLGVLIAIVAVLAMLKLIEV